MDDIMRCLEKVNQRAPLTPQEVSTLAKPTTASIIKAAVLARLVHRPHESEHLTRCRLHMKCFARVVICSPDLRFLVALDVSENALELVSQGVFDILGTPWDGFFYFAHRVIGEAREEHDRVELSWQTLHELATLVSLPGLLGEVAQKVQDRGLCTSLA